MVSWVFLSFAIRESLAIYFAELAVVDNADVTGMMMWLLLLASLMATEVDLGHLSVVQRRCASTALFWSSLRGWIIDFAILDEG